MKNETETIKDLKKELGKYKADTLKVPEKVMFRGHEYSHILPEKDANKNLIDSDVNKKNPDVKRHSLFNHLTSSQALCLNLFGPLVDDHLYLLNPLLGFDVKDSVRAKFEFVDDLIHDRSNFDFFIETKKHERLYFEIKYTEATIHTTCGAKDCNERWRRLYAKPMEIILEDKNSISVDDFCNQYQLWRNICRVANNHCDVYFVFPDFREKLRKQVETAKDLLKPEFKNRVHILTIDTICDTLLNTAEEKYQKHYKEFKKKYFPSSLFGEDNK